MAAPSLLFFLLSLPFLPSKISFVHQFLISFVYQQLFQTFSHDFITSNGHQYLFTHCGSRRAINISPCFFHKQIASSDYFLLYACFFCSSSSPSASRPECVKDCIAILQEIIQVPNGHSSVEGSVFVTGGRHRSFSTPRQLLNADEQRTAKDKEEALKRKNVFIERAKFEQASRQRVAEMAARTTATSTQPSQSVVFSKPVTFTKKN